MKIIPLALLCGSLFFAASAPAAYVTTKFKLLTPGVADPGSLALIYDNTLPIVGYGSGIQQFEMYFGGQTTIFIQGGNFTPGTAFSFLSYNQSTGTLGYDYFYNIYGYGLNSFGPRFNGVIYDDVLIGDHKGRAELLGTYVKVVPIGVPDSGHTAALLLGSLAWMGWKRRKHGHKSIG